MQAEQLKTTLQNLRSRLLTERSLYDHYKKEMELWYPNQWKIVEQSFIAISGYLKNERVRAKHEAADFMKGLNILSGYGENNTIERIHEKIEEVLEALVDDNPYKTAQQLSMLKRLTIEIETQTYAKK